MSRKRVKQEEPQQPQPISGMTQDDGVSLIPRVADPPSEQVAEQQKLEHQIVLAKIAAKAETVRPPEPDDTPDNSVFEGSLFEGLDLPESGTNLPATRPNDGLPALDSDLTEDQKREFVGLLNKKFSLEDRADCLVRLAKMHGTKTAAVGLRAIQEVNSVCGIKDVKPNESTSMFALPDDVKMAILVQKSDK